MKNESQIIHEFLTTLGERADQAGDDKMTYAIKSVYGLLKTFKLRDSDLETMEYKTIRMKEDMNKVA